MDGWNAAHNPEPPPEPMGAEEFEDLIEKHQDWIVSAGTPTVQ